MNRRNKSSDKRTLFVTVGSTKFELLIDTVLSERTMGVLERNGIERIVMQVGNGKHNDQELAELKRDETKKFYRGKIEVVAYMYKSSLRDDLLSADLVISHAGSGSIIESLEADKRLIVVVNESLMDNHQFELAEKMFELNYLLYTTCSGLDEKIDLMHTPEFSLSKYTPGNPRKFGHFLEDMITEYQKRWDSFRFLKHKDYKLF